MAQTQLPLWRPFGWMLDYATVGNYKEGDSFDEWYVGSDLQVAAAMRLLSYFRKEAAPMIVRRLQGLRIERIGSGMPPDKKLAAWVRREAKERPRGILLDKPRTGSIIHTARLFGFDR
ncbi:MAG TPA: hypothetical protein VH575_04255 [Gemmataceae bacterium]|jgi:hypothetical protein